MASPMRTVSFKLPKDLDEELTRLARERGASRSALAREALESFTKQGTRSVTALAGDLVGSVDGPPDLSSNQSHLAGYGE